MKGSAIVIPFFNEASRIMGGKYLKELCELVDADFIYVNDGSTDKTLLKLNEVAKITKAKVINLEKNSGKGEAVRAGLKKALSEGRYRIVGYLDADGAFPALEVTNNLTKAYKVLSRSNIDIYIASRIKMSGRKVERSLVRHYLSRVILTIIGFKTRNMPYDSQSGLKFFRTTENLFEAIDKPFKTRWFFDLELMVRLDFQNRDCTWEEPVSSWKDIKDSAISFRSVFGVAKEIIIIANIVSKS